MHGPDASAFADAVDAVRGGASPETAAQAIVSRLSIAERVWLLDGDERFWPGVSRWALRGYNSVPIVAGSVPRLGIDGLRFTDGPRGVSLGRSTCFPVTMARGATWDPVLEEEVGVALGLEARAQGANLYAGVCINLLRHPAWGRAQETYGEDPIHLGAMGVALTRGVQRNVMACVKHFALNSIENARFHVDVRVDEDVLHEVYLPHFKQVVDAGVRVVMSAYNAVNGRWCGDDPSLLTAILREEWGFAGAVVSDFVWGLRDPIGSVRAGLDIEMPFRQQRARVLGAAAASGTLDRAAIDRAAARILASQLRNAATIDPGEPPLSVVASAAHRELARRVATRAMVLLRNEPIDAAPLLPIDPTTVRSAAVFGRLATCANLGDKGSSSLRPPTAVSPLEGLRAVMTTTYDDGTDHRRAAALAARSDLAIVVVGCRDIDEGEYLLAIDDAALKLMPWPLCTKPAARMVQWLVKRFETTGGRHGGDRVRLGLRAADEALVTAVAAANPRTIVIVIAGSAILMEAWRERVPAILLAWYPGMEGGHAIADVLTGAAEPCGRLPFVIPSSEAHLPSFDRNARSIQYDRWYGYRKLDRDGNPPAFPFGFGLGFTSWRAHDLSVRRGEATVRVSNTGTRAGATVIQLYAGDERQRDRPRRQLVGFARVELEPGASALISIAWSLVPLSRRDPHTRAWSVVPGTYRLEASRYLGDPEAAVASVVLES
ncbi:MAG TPA: glycoside hydrolase family 3 C-terminal domain-containing protein [Kofleriaceae bacterium]